MNKAATLKELQIIPGVGPSIAEDLWNIGIRSIKDLKQQSPDALYEKICNYQNCQVDRCILYVFRLAVYYATETKHDPERLKWWNWKNI